MHVFPDVANVVQEEEHTPQSVGSEPKLYQVMKINALLLTMDVSIDLKH